MKKKYEAPEIETVIFCTDDVICTSTYGYEDNGIEDAGGSIYKNS